VNLRCVFSFFTLTLGFLCRSNKVKCLAKEFNLSQFLLSFYLQFSDNGCQAVFTLVCVSKF